MATRVVISTANGWETVEYREGATVTSRGLEPVAGTAAANAATLLSRAQQALAQNATYLALATPSAAQQTAQINRLTRECSALIRLLLGQAETLTDS